MNIFEKRREKLYSEMTRKNVDCMLIGPSADMTYLMDLSLWPDERLMAAVFSPGHSPFLIANRLLQDLLAASPYQDIVYWGDGEDPYALLSCELKNRGMKTDSLAIDSAMAAEILIPVLAAVPHLKLSVSTQVTAPLRMVKDEVEMQRLRIACQRASNALRETMAGGRAWIGHTESELAAALCGAMLRQGLSYGSASVSVGKNAADAHHISGSTVIEDNMCMWIDFGSTYQNYQTDMTRVFYFGEPDPAYVELVNIVNEAREAGISAAAAGNTLGDVDDAARAVIESYGYGPFFTHRTGHGIGIMNHEGPSAAHGEKTKIVPGMVFSCEPGIYLPGKYGVRVEDELLIESDGHPARLHNFTTDMVVFRK